jgi:acetyl esterase
MPKIGIRLDPDINAFRLLVEGAGQIDPASVPLDMLRDGARSLRLPWNDARPEMAQTEELVLAGLRCRLHRPLAAPSTKPTTIYLHGGGWVLLDLDTHDGVARRLARDSGAPVLLVDYPLAPEYPFPLALLRLREVIVEWERRAKSLGLSSEFSLCGDSAGANLAVALALLLRDDGLSLPQALGLLYGSFSDTFDTPSYQAYGSGDLPLSTQRMRWFWDNYVPDPSRRADPLASPLRADLTGLPPVFLIIAQYDILYDENIAFADSLGTAGNDLTVRVYPGTVHGFVEAAAAVAAAVANRAISDLGRFLSRTLEGAR